MLCLSLPETEKKQGTGAVGPEGQSNNAVWWEVHQADHKYEVCHEYLYSKSLHATLQLNHTLMHSVLNKDGGTIIHPATNHTVVLIWYTASQEGGMSRSEVYFLHANFS